MLGDELNRPKNIDISKSSILAEEADEKKLREMIEVRDKTIRTLHKKIDKLESNLKKTTLVKNSSNHEHHSSEENNYFEMLKLQVNKTKELEDIIKEMTKRINTILEDITQDKSFTDNSEEIRQMLEELQLAQNQSVSQGFLQDNFQNSFSISKEWIKNVDILEGTIKSFKSKCIGYKQQNKSLKLKFEENTKVIETLTLKLKESDDVKLLHAELKEERRQKQKLRGLLDRTQYQKNQFMNKINTIGLKEVEVKAKTKEELLQYSKELNYRVKDLQKQKEAILKETNKERETEMKKYQDVLKKLRTIKDTSRMGKSFA